MGKYHAMISLGDLMRAQGKWDRSKDYYLEALKIQIKTKYMHNVAQILEGMAHVALAEKILR